MTMIPPALALRQRRFGRRFVLHSEPAEARRPLQLSDDARLFATTFAAGFLFVSILIA